MAFLGNSGLLSVWAFLLGCLLVLTTAISHGLRRRPSRVEVFVGAGIAAVYLLIFVRMSVATERSHLVEYGVVAIFMYEAFKERAKGGRFVPLPGVIAILAAGSVGVLDEFLQKLIPARTFDPVDMMFNFGAAVLAVGASAALSWARRRLS